MPLLRLHESSALNESAPLYAAPIIASQKEARATDAMLVSDLAKARVALLNISEMVRDEINRDAVALTKPDFIASVLKDITNVALSSVNATMRYAIGDSWSELTIDDCVPIAGYVSENDLGLYKDRKFTINIDEIRKSNIEPIQHLRELLKMELKKTDTNPFVFQIFEIATHEIFHSIQENRMALNFHMKGFDLELALANGMFRIEFFKTHFRVFVEGGAKFVETYLGSAIDEKITERSMQTETDNAFFASFSLHTVSDFVYKNPRSVMRELKKKSAYDQGLFIFAATMAANGSFTETVRDMYYIARQGTYKDRNMYAILREAFASGSIEKLKARLATLTQSTDQSSMGVPNEERENTNDAAKDLNCAKRP